MKFTIDTKVLEKHKLSLGDFLLLLMGYHDIQYEKCYHKLVDMGLANENFYSRMSLVLSDNVKEKVAGILAECDSKVQHSGIDFESVAKKMQALYPEGKKPGTTYSWRGTTEEIVRKLHALVAKYDFLFTEEEAVMAVKKYIEEFSVNNRQHMSILKCFILKTYKDHDGFMEISSQFMSYIEDIRDNKEN